LQHACAVGDELRTDDRERNHRELDPGCHGERCEERELELPPPSRLGDEADAGVNRCEHERIRERVGEHAGGVDAVRDRDGQSGHREPEPLREREAPAEQECGNRRDGDERSVQPLREMERCDGVLRDQPDGRCDERLQKRREVRAGTADERSPMLGEAACERRIDVLVGEVVRRRTRERRDQPSAEARGHDPGEPGPRGHGGKAREGARELSFGPSGGSLDSHICLFGRRRLSLEGVTPPCAVSGNEKLAVRALEAAVALGLSGDQFRRERLLAVRADDLLLAVCSGDIGHWSTVHAACYAGQVNRRAWFEPITPLGQT
jgi:hypothetical protein